MSRGERLICGAYWHDGVPPSLPFRGISRHNAAQKRRRGPSSALLSPRHGFSALRMPFDVHPTSPLYNLCVSSAHSSKFKPTPAPCLCVCVYTSLPGRFLCLIVVFASCVCWCVCVQSARLQALMRQRAFLFLWPLSKHIKSYLITAYTARPAHTHTHTLNITPNTHKRIHHAYKKKKR